MKHTRPRSADLGGLHLATEGSGLGQGWLGYSGEMTRFAELLTDMYSETLNAVNERDTEFAPTDLPTETRIRLIHSLDSWGFEPHNLPDEEVLACTMMLFEALFRIENMQDCLGISLKDQIYPLIHHLRRIYRWENTYHNFEHALDVLQCSYIFLRSAGMVPPVSILLDEDPELTWSSRHKFDSGPLITCLGLKELFVVYIAAIGHDVAHPGFTNVFMKNAETPLSIVYDGKSALEQMHCSLLLRVMRHYGLGPLLDNHNGNSQSMKKLLSETVLATDMSVHATFMSNFKGLVDDGYVVGEGRLWKCQVLLCQGLLKCADISNPFRPYNVSQHWAAALMGEWTSQAMLEKFMDLPCTVQCSDDPLTEASGQVFFINTFAKPLLELMVEAIPELQVRLDQCKDNLKIWENRRVTLTTTSGKTIHEQENSPRAPSSLSFASSTSSFSRKRDDYLTAFPLALPKHHPYRNLSHANRLQIESENNQVITSDTESKQERSEEVDGISQLPPPRSSTSTATTATLVWPMSASFEQKQKLLSPPLTGLSSLHPRSEESYEYNAKTGIRTMSTSSSASLSMSPPTSPCESLPSSASGGSEYMSVADWISIGSASHGAASSYRTTGCGDECDNSSVDEQRLAMIGEADSIRQSASYSRSSANSMDGNKNGSHSHNFAPTHMHDPHAGLRAAADSARPMLRKQRSMLNRKSWGAPGEYFFASKTMDGTSMTSENGYLGVGASPLLDGDSSVSPPPLTSPASLGLAQQQQLRLVSPITRNSSAPDSPESPTVMTTPKSARNLHHSTIVVAEPHPHIKEIQAI
ncbi:hypothetical protein GYMLUDRAFT_719559 [Collybiopsis luxurians FD-317 M1]|nr:hypothetical protein GYMLUDRAFT_719559 [Collybiopsis luxurians FD-317 M1]